MTSKEIMKRKRKGKMFEVMITRTEPMSLYFKVEAPNHRKAEEIALQMACDANFNDGKGSDAEYEFQMTTRMD
jgi:hypothetical protein